MTIMSCHHVVVMASWQNLHSAGMQKMQTAIRFVKKNCFLTQQLVLSNSEEGESLDE